MAAPQSKEDVFALALRLLQEEAVVSIDPPDEDRKAAQAGEDWFDHARRDVLSEHPWTFARKRVSILKESTAPAFEYENQYQLPSDFIRLVRIGTYYDDNEVDYEIEGDYILCDVSSPLPLIYVFDQQDITKFSPKFITCLALRLAEFMAYDITGNATLVDVMGARYDAAITQAVGISGQDRPTRRIQRSKFSGARRSYGRYSNYKTWSDS